MGLCGWKIWDDPQDSDRMMAQFQGTEKKENARSYKIQFTASGRAFIRPYGRRIYMDEVLLVN